MYRIGEGGGRVKAITRTASTVKNQIEPKNVMIQLLKHHSNIAMLVLFEIFLKSVRTIEDNLFVQVKHNIVEYKSEQFYNSFRNI